MLNRRTQIEIAFEIAREFVFDSNWQDQSAWCNECESFVPLVNMQTAATLEKTTNVTIFRRVETGALHHKVTNDGALFICLSSLLETGQCSAGTEFVGGHLPKF